MAEEAATQATGPAMRPTMGLHPIADRLSERLDRGSAPLTNPDESRATRSVVEPSEADVDVADDKAANDQEGEEANLIDDTGDWS